MVIGRKSATFRSAKKGKTPVSKVDDLRPKRIKHYEVVSKNSEEEL